MPENPHIHLAYELSFRLIYRSQYQFSSCQNLRRRRLRARAAAPPGPEVGFSPPPAALPSTSSALLIGARDEAAARLRRNGEQILTLPPFEIFSHKNFKAVSS